MRITTGMVQRHLLADLHRANERLARTQGKLSSGKELMRPSDDPAAAGKALQLREALDATRQHVRSAQDGLAWMEATEQALAQMTDIVQRARELVVRGSTDGSDPAARQAIATEIGQLAEALKEQANTSFGGRRLFAGTQTQTAPYGAGDAYAGDTGAIAREIGPGVSIAVNVPAAGLLGSGQAAADDLLLHVLRDVHDHLLADDGASLRGTDLQRLDANLERLLAVRAENGARTNRLDGAVARLAQVEELTMKTLSDTEDADMARTLVDLSTQQAAYQAALRSSANIMQASLMDFLRP